MMCVFLPPRDSSLRSRMTRGEGLSLIDVAGRRGRLPLRFNNDFGVFADHKNPAQHFNAQWFRVNFAEAKFQLGEAQEVLM